MHSCFLLTVTMNCAIFLSIEFVRFRHLNVLMQHYKIQRFSEIRPCHHIQVNQEVDSPRLMRQFTDVNKDHPGQVSVFLKFFIQFYFWLCCAFWVFVSTHGLSLVVVSGGYSLVAVQGLHIAVATLFVEHGLWGVWASVDVALTGSGAQAQQLWHMGLVALQQVGSSWIRD